MNTPEQQRMWARILLVAAAALAFVIFALGTAPAQEYEHPPAGAGDPYTGYTNPKHGYDCCHGLHCSPLPPGGVKLRIRADGVRVYDFNHRGKGRWYSIPADETTTSFDHRWHSCVMHGERGEYDPCLLVPGAV